MKKDYIFRKIDHHHTNISKVNNIYDELRDLLDENVIAYKTRRLKNLDEDLLEYSKEEYYNSARDSESHKHELLKAYIATYMRESGEKPVFEKRCWFGVADVATEDGNTFAEVGKVHIEKLLNAFGYSAKPPRMGEEIDSYQTAERLFLVPYSMNSEEPPARAIDLFKK